jgi:hypothetical protein
MFLPVSLLFLPLVLASPSPRAERKQAEILAHLLQKNGTAFCTDFLAVRGHVYQDHPVAVKVPRYLKKYSISNIVAACKNFLDYPHTTPEPDLLPKCPGDVLNVTSISAAITEGDIPKMESPLNITSPNDCCSKCFDGSFPGCGAWIMYPKGCLIIHRPPDNTSVCATLPTHYYAYREEKLYMGGFGPCASTTYID